MTEIFILTSLLIVSVGLNVFFIWYGRKLLNDLYYMSDNLGSLVEQVLAFSAHLVSVHELEMFYGDDVLGGLINHSKDLIATLEDFVDIVALFEGNEDLLEEDNQDVE